MAEEKKKPDLKARLNRTVVGAAPPPGPAATPGADGPVPPPAGVPVPPGEHGTLPFPMGAPPAPDFVAPAGLDLGTHPGAGGGDAIAVPEFIQEQMRQRAAEDAARAQEAAAAAARAQSAARAAAAAANPFDSVISAPASQEVRLVIDEKAVSDDEVGRKRTGTFVGYGITALVMLGAGYLVGQQMESRAEGHRTMDAVSDIQRQVNTAGATIATMKDKVDHAAAAAGIQGPDAPEGQAPTPAPAPGSAHVDEELVTWFSQQNPDPPFSADSYANRVGRLRPDLVTKLMKVQLGLAQAWTDLRHHQEITQRAVPVINAALTDAQRTRGEFNRMMVVFARNPSGEPPIMGTLVATTANPAGQITIAPVLGVATRTIYTGGDLSAPATLGTVGIPVSDRAGVAAAAVRGIGQPWADYVSRVRSLKTLVDALANDHRSLSEALSHSGG